MFEADDDCFVRSYTPERSKSVAIEIAIGI